LGVALCQLRTAVQLSVAASVLWLTGWKQPPFHRRVGRQGWVVVRHRRAQLEHVERQLQGAHAVCPSDATAAGRGRRPAHSER
jgi:hypothetical protein